MRSKILERLDFGEKKYGAPLRMGWDKAREAAMEEALDGFAYARLQGLSEVEDHFKLAYTKLARNPSGWTPFVSVSEIPEGPVWVLRHDPTEHPEGGLRCPKVSAATVVTYKRWHGPRLFGPQGISPMNLTKMPVLAWRTREATPEVPSDWRKYLGVPEDSDPYCPDCGGSIPEHQYHGHDGPEWRCLDGGDL